MKMIKLYEDFLNQKKQNNCFDNVTNGVVQLLPHNFDREGKNVVCKENPKFDSSKKSILLIPGGDGKPAVDYQFIAKELTDYNLFSVNYIQEKFGDIESWSKKMAESAVNVIPGNFSVVGFSLGTSIAFFAIKNVFNSSEKFNKKFVCIDAGLPPEGTGDEKKDFENKVNNMMTGNPPQKYNCMRRSKVKESSKRSLGSEDAREYRYSYKKKTFDMNSFQLNPYKISDFVFSEKTQKNYENWRANKSLVYEYLDDVTGNDRSHTFVNKKPSAIYQKGNPIDLKDPQLNKKLKELEISAKDDIWVVRDKWESDNNPTKQFWYEKNFQNLFNWVLSHVKNTGKTRNKGEKIPPGIKVLLLKAGQVVEKLDKEKYSQSEDYLNEIPTESTEDTRLEIIEDCIHGTMLEKPKSSKDIANYIKDFLK